MPQVPMHNEKYNWIKIAESVAEIPFNDNGLAEVNAAGKLVCVGRFENTLFAFAPKCPHASGTFLHGTIDAQGNVVCPLHRYKFCLKNGRNVTGEGYYLKHWPVDIQDEGVFIGLEKGLLANLF
ncbi:MAG: Rieske 2Fe-2S protein [Flaviaesturariibacter sp.]|nr:Rieske 2Fe-2S protein [Flaviaesturariibacter sp.]